MGSDRQLAHLTIRGFKSIRELSDFELGSLNVFVGANGAGKSNLISFFRLLRALMEDNLSDYILKNGGVGDLLFNGRKTTAEMFFETHFGPRGYRFKITPGADEESFAVADEARYYAHGTSGWWKFGSSGNEKSMLVREVKSGTRDAEYSRPVYDAVCSWKIYHFHDTGDTAAMRHAEIVQDGEILRPDAANLAPFLLRMREEEAATYQEVLDVCRIVVPYLDDFLLKPKKYGAAEKVSLAWKTKGTDYPMQPYHFSDGSIRFICLAAALLQPTPPAAIIIDEPELGLHPEAIRLLGELLKDAAKRTQLIVATQSPLLLDQFAIEDIVVANRKDGQSVFERFDRKDFTAWLEDYSVGELWAKNVIRGGTGHE
ncbi:MAG: AAA family ATPase [Oscillospiraceae bacterium]|jgi:predicted ATPase|nr:AAA family ATPase [Oscillospiraceae bacterium]